MINLLRILRLALAFLVFWQTDKLIKAFIYVIGYNKPVSDDILGAIMGKFLLICFFVYMIYKLKLYINSLAIKKNKSILKDWYSI